MTFCFPEKKNYEREICTRKKMSYNEYFPDIHFLKNIPTWFKNKTLFKYFAEFNIIIIIIY